MASAIEVSGSKGSIELLIEEFEKKLHRVEVGLRLSDSLYYSVEGQSNLRDICWSILDLRAINKVLRVRIDSVKKNIESLQERQRRLYGIRCRINHICYDLPANVPKALQEVKVSNPKQDIPKENALEVKNDKENEAPKKAKNKVKCLKLLQLGDYERLPRYVKGHLSMEQINTGISEVNTVLEKKYEFLKRPRKTLTRAEDRKRNVCLEMGKDLKGTIYEIFFMDSDIQEYGKLIKAKPKTRDVIFLILRHLGKMKEIKRGKPSRYCILGG